MESHLARYVWMIVLDGWKWKVLWCSEATPHEQWKETKDWRTKTQMNAKVEDQKLFLNSEFLKSQSPLQVSDGFLL
jgi:hypothetical protein